MHKICVRMCPVKCHPAHPSGSSGLRIALVIAFRLSFAVQFVGVICVGFVGKVI